MRNCINARIVRLFGIIALAAIIGFSMVGCKSDDGGGGNIEGTWQLKFKDSPGYEAGMEVLWGIDKDAVLSKMVFKGGKVTVTEYDLKDGTEETSEGTYTVSGNTVTITIDGEPGKATINGNKLTITGEDGESVTFTKK